VLKHILMLGVLTAIVALAGVAFAYHSERMEVRESHAKPAQTTEPILRFDEKPVTPM
jgi:hypothetical protein